MNVSELLRARNLPDFPSRDKMVQLIQENEYGYMPDLDYQITFSDPVSVNKRFCDSTVEYSRVTATVTTRYGSHTFPVNRMLHTDGTVNPFFIHISFSPNVPNIGHPAEEIADNGFDVLSFNYTDVASDDGDFTNGLPKIFMPNGQQSDSDCGKIMFWAWAAMRIMDYAQTLPQLDQTQSAVIGHSRLGKTALLTGMLDERIRYVFSNNSGGSGAALARGNSGVPGQLNCNAADIFNFEQDFTTGETIRDILKNFPYWFCKNYQKYAVSNTPTDFDQHFLVASIAPRYVYVASASKDLWADPVSEFLCAAAASKHYEAMGLTGLVHNNTLPQPEEYFHEGRIGYHMRKGPHFHSRHDWARYMAFIRKHQFD